MIWHRASRKQNADWRRTLSLAIPAFAVLAATAASATDWLSPVPLRQQSTIPAQGGQANGKPAPAGAANQQAALDKRETNLDIGAWKLHCLVDQQRKCELSQRRIDNTSKTTALWIEIDATETEDSVYTISLLTPLGMKITQTTPLMGDNKVAVAIPIISCVPAGCVHRAMAPRQAIDGLVSLRNIGAQVMTQNGQPLFLPLDTSGFLEGLSKMKALLNVAITSGR